MRTGTLVALPIALVVLTGHDASLAPRSLPKAELIHDVNKVGEHGFCRFDFTFGSDSCPEQFTPLATDVAFMAVEPINGFALWRTDGTRAGTTLIRDVNSIRIFNPIVAGNGVMFFVAQDRSGQFGTELWRSDGTFNGTVMVADLNPGPASSQGPSPQMLNAAGMLYFLATDGVSGGELWKIEAGRSVPGTGLLPRPQLVKDIYPGPGHGGPNSFAFAGSTLFFVAQDPEHGLELWKSDGTAEGTVLVKDILPGPGSSIPFHDRAVRESGAVHHPFVRRRGAERPVDFGRHRGGHTAARVPSVCQQHHRRRSARVLFVVFRRDRPRVGSHRRYLSPAHTSSMPAQDPKAWVTRTASPPSGTT